MPDQNNAPGSVAPTTPAPENNGTGTTPNNAPENNGVNETPPGQQPPEAKNTIEVPKDKWDQMYARAKSAEEKTKEFEEAEKKRLEAQALSEGKYQEVIDGLKSTNGELLQKANSLEAMETTLQKYLDAEISKVDESKKGLIPENFTTQQKLDYIVQNQAFLYSAEAKTNNATPPLPKSEDEMAMNELEKAKIRLKELRDKRDQTGHLTTVEMTEVSKLARMVTAVAS